MFPGEAGGLNKHLVPVDGEEAVVPALAAEGEGGGGGAGDDTAGGSPGAPRPCGGGVWSPQAGLHSAHHSKKYNHQSGKSSQPERHNFEKILTMIEDLQDQ